MCGIAGMVCFDGRPADPRMLNRMVEGQAHRGPDGRGVVCRGSVGLGHCRLAIIDPAGGAQPLASDDGRLVLTYNGEVYNYKEIRETLDSAGTFRTHCDTEVVLRAYQQWGIDCVKRFRGMFAFALYDQPQGKLYLVRDRVGIKPLYYFYDEKRLLFASELQALVDGTDIPRRVRPDALAGYLRYQYVPTPLSIYENSWKLEPGWILTVDVVSGKISKAAYWNVAPEPVAIDETQATEALRETLDEAVRLHLRSDVPFGAFLSGGIDSSIVTALMQDEMTTPVRTFSIGYHEGAYSELPYAAEASRSLSTAHRERIIEPNFDRAFLVKLLRHFGEPFADSSTVPTYWVSRMAADEVKMVLSGDGGDELFGGYQSHIDYFRYLSDPWRPLKRLVYGLGAAMTGREYPRRVAALAALDLRQWHHCYREIFSVAEVDRLLVVPGRSNDPPHPPTAPTDDPIAVFQWQDLKTYLVDDILTKVDRMSMANSLEVRVPLLDHKVVELAFRLPLDLRLRRDDGRGVTSKYLLRKIGDGYFAEGFFDRPKMGFGIPVTDWCRGPLWAEIRETLLDSDNPMFEWLDIDAVGRVVTAFEARPKNAASQIWCLFVLALWAKHIHNGEH